MLRGVTIVALVLGTLSNSGLCQTIPPDDQARFIAGLTVSADSPLKKLEEQELWKKHADTLNKEWKTFEDGRLLSIQSWSEAELKNKTPTNSNLFYMFGGPDFITVHMLYPGASEYILAGLEPLGKIPDLQSVKEKALAMALNNIIVSLKSIIKLSFFRTLDMMGDLRRSELPGVLPIFYTLLARTDHKVFGTDYVTVDDNGGLLLTGEVKKVAGKKYVDGIRVAFKDINGTNEQKLLFFQLNLDDPSLKQNPGFVKFLEAQGTGVSFLKAASYIPFRNDFSIIKNFLLSNSLSILQDDTGIPFRQFKPEKWDFTLYGNYTGPIPIFKWCFQKDLQEAFKERKEDKPIPFLTGYNFSSGSHFIYARAK